MARVTVDVGDIVQRTVASLYSHLVTRPTGRAVRSAIERRMAETRGRILSLVDFSEVRVLDYSCADEVVAKLLLGSGPSHGRDAAFFVFRGIRDLHRDPIDAVLERQSLLAVGETVTGRFELLGAAADAERRVWTLMEAWGSLPVDAIAAKLPGSDDRRVLDGLVERRVVLEDADRREYRALSTLVPPREHAR